MILHYDTPNEPQSRTQTICDKKVLRTLIKEDRTQSTRELASPINIDHTTALRHIHVVGIKKW